MVLKRLGPLGLAFIILSCSNGPKVLESESEAAKEIFQPAQTASNTQSSAHQVYLIDTLGGSRYSYLKVREGAKEFWLATLKSSYVLNEEYIFTKGIYKTDYYSTAFNRTFEEIYLVSDLRPLNAAATQPVAKQIFEAPDKTEGAARERQNLGLVEGGTSIKELIENSDRYVDQEVKLTAEVVKINANIMDRHWLHLKDGSFDSFDLVATSQTAVPAGHVVNLKATLRKSVDFGAGYSYDLILENAEVLP